MGRCYWFKLFELSYALEAFQQAQKRHLVLYFTFPIKALFRVQIADSQALGPGSRKKGDKDLCRSEPPEASFATADSGKCHTPA